jgi:membrane protein
MKAKLREARALLMDVWNGFNADGVPRLAASLAYFTALSLAPLLVVVIAAIGLLVNQETIRAEILVQVESAVGADAAALVDGLIANAMNQGGGLISIILGVGGLLLGAAAATNNLQVALDLIFDVPPQARPSGLLEIVKTRLISFAMLLVVGFLLLVSLVASTALSVLNAHVLSLMPLAELLVGLLNIGLSFAMTTLLFALIFRYLPSIRLTWRDVIVGAAVTAALFTVGRTLLGSYLGSSGTASAYGAAGAFVLILIWVYYSAQIVLLGAEFTHVYAQRYGSLRATEPSATGESAVCSTIGDTPPTLPHPVT